MRVEHDLSNEKYHVHGGNDQITERMATTLGGQITYNAELVAIRQASRGGYTLTFKLGSQIRDVSADKVVLALPFSILRSSVDTTRAGFSARKYQAINELGMGANSKLQLQFTSRLWETLGCSGDTFADTGYQASWGVTRGQSGGTGILVKISGRS